MRTALAIGAAAFLVPVSCTDDAAPACDVVVDGLSSPVCAELAVAEAERRRGLGGRASLVDDAGLLIRFPVTDELCIHNATVGFAIDAIWLDELGGVVAVEQYEAGDATPRCAGPARMVLEVPAGIHEAPAPDASTLVATPPFDELD